MMMMFAADDDDDGCDGDCDDECDDDNSVSDGDNCYQNHHQILKDGDDCKIRLLLSLNLDHFSFTSRCL